MLWVEIRVSRVGENRFFFSKNLLRVIVNGKREKVLYDSVCFELD